MQGSYRFDGLKASHVPIILEDGQVPVDQNIQSPFWEDQQGNLWFSTVHALYCFDRLSGRSKEVKIKIQNEEPDDTYRVFYLEKISGILWLRAGDFVFTYNIYTQDISDPLFGTKGYTFAVDTLASGILHTIYACPWSVEETIEVWEKDKEGCWVRCYANLGLDKQTTVSQLLIGQDDKLWLITNAGLFSVTKSFSDQAMLYRPQNLNQFHCWSGDFFPGNRQLLLASKDHGLWSFDTKKKEFSRNWIVNSQSPNSLSTNGPIAVYIDYDEIIWSAHIKKGLDYASFSSSVFSNPTASSPSRPARVRQIFEDTHQRIWVLTHQQEILIFDLEGQFITSFAASAIDQNSLDITHLSIDLADTIWAAVSDDKIFTFPPEANLSTANWSEVLTTKEDILTLFHDQFNQKWCITRNGVFKFENSTENPQLFSAEEFLAYPGFQFDYFYQAEDLTIFIPYNSQSLWIARKQEGRLNIIEKYPELSGDTYAVIKSRFSDTTWVSTEKGLYGYLEGQLFPVLNQQDFNGPCNIFGAIEDDSAGLWLSSNRGIWHWKANRQELLQFSDADGLADNTFTRGAVLRASDGRIWMGSNGGLSVFDPNDVNDKFPVPKGYIEKLWVNNIPYDPGLAINEMSNLDLNYRENTLVFELKAITNYQADAAKIRFRLRNYDENWTTIPNGNYARFTKIPAGKYIFDFFPLNAHGQKGVQRSLTIRIKPPFWQTIWFKTLMVLLAFIIISSIIGAYYQRKLRQKQREIEKQQAIIQERDRIAKELHDDTGSDLSTILFLSEDLHLEELSTQQRQIERISKLAESSLENMQVIIWALDPDKDALQDLNIRLKNMASKMLTVKNISLDFKASIPSEKIVLGAEKRKNIYLIAKEALHNIIKHAEADHVSLTFKLEADHLKLIIQDNGQGFDQNQQEITGHGLNNMQKRALDINGKLKLSSSIGKGTLLQLDVPIGLLK